MTTFLGYTDDSPDMFLRAGMEDVTGQTTKGAFFQALFLEIAKQLARFIGSSEAIGVQPLTKLALVPNHSLGIRTDAARTR